MGDSFAEMCDPPLNDRDTPTDRLISFNAKTVVRICRFNGDITTYFMFGRPIHMYTSFLDGTLNIRCIYMRYGTGSVERGRDCINCVVVVVGSLENVVLHVTVHYYRLALADRMCTVSVHKIYI